MSYSKKLNDSFKTKWELFLFEIVISNRSESVDSFESFQITKELIGLFTRRFKQYYYDEKIGEDDSKEIQEIYNQINLMRNRLDESLYLNNYQKHFHKILTPEQYKNLTSSHQCYYCELKLSEFEKLYDQHLITKKANRGFTLEIDRKNPNEEYYYKNLVMACYWCNNAKTDEFSAEEFKPIGEAIGATFKRRLEKLNK